MEEEDIGHQRTLRLQRSAGDVSCTQSRKLFFFMIKSVRAVRPGCATALSQGGFQ